MSRPRSQIDEFVFKQPLYVASYSPDGRHFVVTSSDRSARIFDVTTHQQVVLNGHGGQVTNAVFSPDGHRLVTASMDGTARIWRVFRTTAELVDYAKEVVPRCLTREQRANASLNLEPPLWCVEMWKWPYDTKEWRNWLTLKRANADPPLPIPKLLPWPRGM